MSSRRFRSAIARAQLESIRQLQREVPLVQVALTWGVVEWRASTASLSGTSRDGNPFTISGLSARLLAEWLRGELIEVVFPNMDPCDRCLLRSGYCKQ